MPKVSNVNTAKELDSLAVKNYQGELFYCTLSSGKQVAFRTMIVKDIMFVENLQKKGKGDTMTNLLLMERLSVEPNKITAPEIMNMPTKDFTILAETMAEATGVDVKKELEDDEDLDLDTEETEDDTEDFN